MQFAGATGTLARDAGIALLDMIGTPVILFTHSQGGGIGFDITEARPQLVQAMVDGRTRRPAVRQRGHGQGRRRVRGTRTRGGSTNNRYEYDPPANAPADLNVVLEEKSERPDEVRCWMQVEPARKLARWKNIRVLDVSANGTYHRVYDPCIPKFLNQAGVKADFVRLEEVGIRGNSHMMMLEKNSDDIIKFIVGWIRKKNTAAGVRALG